MSDSLADALRLRAWAIRVLASGWTQPPAVDPRAWRLFLRAERCAVALSTRTEGDAPPLLHAVATVELQRILSARAQLETLGRLLTGAGARALVLKGGLMALGSPIGVDLVDVDVLAEPGAASRVAALLDARGYASVGPGASAHLAQRHQPYAIHVEVHHALTEMPAAEMWSRADPVPAHPGLWKPAYADVAWHALVHSAVTHPFRRGCLRDALLIAWADAAAGPEGRAALADRLAAHPWRPLLEEVLRLARDIRDDHAPVDSFRRAAAAHYLFTRSRALGGEAGLRPHIMRSVFSRLDGDQARREYWRSVWTGRSDLSPWSGLAGLEEWWPAGGRLARRVLRMARLPFVEAVAWPVARRARKLGDYAEPATGARTLDIRSGSP